MYINSAFVELSNYVGDTTGLTQIGSGATLLLNGGNIQLGYVQLVGGTLNFKTGNASVNTWLTNTSNYGKIVIYPTATFSTPLPTIPATYEVVDLRTTIPVGDTNRTQIGIQITAPSMYALESSAQTIAVPVGTSLRSLLTALPKNLTGTVVFNLGGDQIGSADFIGFTSN
jgi:hypothetical protein